MASLGGYNTAINVVIAALMALIGLLFFICLLRESTLLRMAASGGAFWLIIMFMLTFADYFHPFELKSEARLADGLDGTVRRFLHCIYSEGVIRV